MPSLGPAEILVILVVALLVFGPNKMPEIGRQVARGVREFRRVQQHLTSELQSVVADLDPTAPGARQLGRRPGSHAAAARHHRHVGRRRARRGRSTGIGSTRAGRTEAGRHAEPDAVG